MRISEAALSDEGQYRCRAWHDVGETISNAATLDVWPILEACPVADRVNSGWTPTPVWDALDDEVSILSSDGLDPSTKFIVKLRPIRDPGKDTDHRIAILAAAPGATTHDINVTITDNSFGGAANYALTIEGT